MPVACQAAAGAAAKGSLRATQRPTQAWHQQRCRAGRPALLLSCLLLTATCHQQRHTGAHAAARSCRRWMSAARCCQRRTALQEAAQQQQQPWSVPGRWRQHMATLVVPAAAAAAAGLTACAATAAAYLCTALEAQEARWCVSPPVLVSLETLQVRTDPAACWLVTQAEQLSGQCQASVCVS
jgi:hypothetical protein